MQIIPIHSFSWAQIVTQMSAVVTVIPHALIALERVEWSFKKMDSKLSVAQKEDSSISFTVTTPDASNWGTTFKPLIGSTSFKGKYCLLCVVLGLGMELY